MALESARTVGRAPELERLEGALDVLAEGSAACLTVAGEPGIGKTHLLGELRRSAEERGHRVLAGSAAEFERDTPFAVWVDALDAYVASQDLTAKDAWTPELEAELGEILPSLRRGKAGGDRVVADERYRAHRAVRSLLECISDDKPLVVALDDLHWADDASIELIASLVRRGPESPVLMALALRPGQAPERLSGALFTASVIRLELGQLSQEQASELVGDIDAKALATIYRHGGGNPFYLEQLARASDEGRLQAALHQNGDGAGDDQIGVPAAVAAALAEELESLPAPVRSLLDAAAVAGEPFEPDLAAAVAGLSDAEGLDALDDLLALDLVRPTQVPRRFTFRHPLIRRAVYESTKGGWRLAAHARAADALKARGAAAVERAHHVEQSAGQGDAEAIELLLEAGEAASARAPAAASRWFEAALRLLPAGDRERHVDVRVALASALRSMGELERCRATLLEAIELLPADSTARRVELTALCAAVEHWLGRHEEAHRRLLRAWDELPGSGTAEEAALQIELAVDGLYALDFEQAIERGREALETARVLCDRPLIAAAGAALALAEVCAGQVEPAREHHALALEQIEGLSDAELAPQLEALYYLGWAESYLERYDDAIAHADRGIAIARATGEGRLLVPMMLVKGYPFEMQGKVAAAVELCETAVEATRPSANSHYLFWALFELGFALYHVGDLDRVIAVCEESARVGGRLVGGTMPAGGGGPGWMLAAAQFELGEVERGFETMEALGGGELDRATPVERCFFWESLALAELARDRPGDADSYARRAEEHAAQLGLAIPAAASGRARAAVLMHAGEHLEAAAVAERSYEAAAGVGANLQAAFSRSLMGRALAAAGERERAIEVLREAEGEFDRCGSVRERDTARRELRKLGARSEKRGPAAAGESGVEALTKRELEIANLVTDRKTNREIAAELFLSAKTIESHMRNIFVKLGASSRVEVARALERHRREAGES